MSKKRNRHTEEFKREAVRLILSRGERTVGDIARRIGVTECDLHRWRDKHGSAVFLESDRAGIDERGCGYVVWSVRTSGGALVQKWRWHAANQLVSCFYTLFVVRRAGRDSHLEGARRGRA